ncbi:MAG: YceI family protein, partial [Candidatus Marinimicrobia bacterium]|nr:YceI family protein [Candidatus Neomarinimicrobiota bacterium]
FGEGNRYISRNGFVSFFSKAPLEDIYAENNNVSCLLDMNTGEVAFLIPIKKFRFEKSLMQEHFNENYMESDKYPNATFQGKINQWESIRLVDSTSVSLSGLMKIHGVEKKINAFGTFQNIEGKISGSASFEIELNDYGIQIPKILFHNIAERVQVEISVKLREQN